MGRRVEKSGAPMSGSQVEAPEADRTALFLDVDGTLLDIAPSPTAVVVPDGLIASIAAIERALNGALALISGRTLAELDRLFHPLRLRASGVHGAEIRFEADSQDIITAHAVSLPAALWSSLSEALTDFPGVFAENKLFSFAVHYRAAPECGPRVLETLNKLVELEDNPDVEIIAAHLAFEIKARGFDKGSAIERFLGRAPFSGRTPIFIGDDWTDEAGFAAVARRGGAAYSVGRPRPGVKAVFSGPSMVRDWLADLAAQPVRA
jgi:trehalose 6-phosphate phosphatase